MSQYKDAVIEVLKGVQHMIDAKVDKTTKIYNGIVVSSSGEKWNIQFNGEVHAIKSYGSIAPQIGTVVKVFVPQGNYSMAWFTIAPEEQFDEEQFRILNLEINHPVGSWWISDNPTSPAKLFGGSWEKLEGRFLLGAGKPTANSDNYFGSMSGVKWTAVVGETGGQDYHALTIKEMPSHSHGFYQYNLDGTEKRWTAQSSEYILAKPSYALVTNTGGNDAHNNMPPYYVTYMWKRIK